MKPKKDGMTVFHVSASRNDIHTLDFALKVVKDNSAVNMINEEVIICN